MAKFANIAVLALVVCLAQMQASRGDEYAAVVLPTTSVTLILLWPIGVFWPTTGMIAPNYSSD